MLVQAPCKGCEERQVGCHSQCERYLSYVKMKDEQKKELDEIRYSENDFYKIVTRKWR